MPDRWRWNRNRRCDDLASSPLAGLPILNGVIRFAIFIPVNIYAGYARGHWDLIKNHTELQGSLFTSAIASAAKIGSKWGNICFYWSFSVWIPAAFVPAPLNIPFGAMDAVISVYISIAIHYLTGHVPHSAGPCKGSGAHDFHRPPNSNESFFETAVRLNATDHGVNATAADVFNMCKGYTEEWRYGVAVVFFYWLMALLSILPSLAICFFSYQESKRLGMAFSKGLLKTTTQLPRFLGIFVYAFFYLFYFIPSLFFRCLPISVKSKVRVARRYGVKASLGVEQKGEMQMHKLKRRMEKSTEKGWPGAREPGVPVTLAEFLSVYDMLIEVAQHLHFVDVRNLALVSKSVRQAVLPADEYRQRVNHFRTYTCEDEGKSQCFICTNQICSKCSQSRNPRQTVLYFHLDSCKAYCTPCYTSTVHSPNPSLPVRWRTRQGDSRFCQCAPPTIIPNFLQRYINGPVYYSTAHNRLPFVSRRVCRSCASLTDEELLERRKKRTKWELKWGCKEREQQGKGMCAKCGCRLASGPRWMVCALCKMECRSLVHGAWRMRVDGRREEVAEGEEAV